MRHTMAKAKHKSGKMKTDEVRIRQLDDGTFHVAHHKKPETERMDHYVPSPPPEETSHPTFKKAAKHMASIFGPGDATAQAADADAEPDADDAEAEAGNQ